MQTGFISNLLFSDNRCVKTSHTHRRASCFSTNSRFKRGFHITITSSLNRSALSLVAGLLPLRDSSSHLNREGGSGGTENHLVCLFSARPRKHDLACLCRADRKKTPLGRIYRQFGPARRLCLPYKAPSVERNNDEETAHESFRLLVQIGYTNYSFIKLTAS